MTQGEDKPRYLVFVVLDMPADRLAAVDPAAKRVASPQMVKSVLLSLVGHLNAKRSGSEVWPSVTRLAELTGLTDRSVRQALRQLQALDLVKVRGDSGKTSVYTINDPAIRALADPGRQVRGSRADPGPLVRGTPDLTSTDPGRQVRGPRTTSPPNSKGTANEVTETNSRVSPVGCSTELKVQDGPHQRKLAVHGLVAETAGRLRSPVQEQPTENNRDEPQRRLAVGARQPRERPG